MRPRSCLKPPRPVEGFPYSPLSVVPVFNEICRINDVVGVICSKFIVVDVKPSTSLLLIVSRQPLAEYFSQTLSVRSDSIMPQHIFLSRNPSLHIFWEFWVMSRASRHFGVRVRSPTAKLHVIVPSVVFDSLSNVWLCAFTVFIRRPKLKIIELD